MEQTILILASYQAKRIDVGLIHTNPILRSDDHDNSCYRSDWPRGPQSC